MFFTAKPFWGFAHNYWIPTANPNQEYGIKFKEGDQWWTVEEFESIFNAGLAVPTRNT